MSFGASHFGDRISPGAARQSSFGERPPGRYAEAGRSNNNNGFGGLTRRLEVTPFELDIKSNIQKLSDTTRLADEQLEDFLRQTRSKRAAGIGSSLEGFLKRARNIVYETEDLFREWTVALAGEPTERHRKKVAQEKLQRAFDDSLATLRETERRCKNAQGEAKGSSSDRDRDRDRYDNRADDYSRGAPQSRDEEDGLVGGRSSVLNNISREREEGIRNVQTRVHEVSGIFRDFAALVGEQGEQLQGIESMASASSEHTRGAVFELKSAANRQGDGGSRFCCIGAGIVVLIGVLVVLRVAGFLGGDAGNSLATAG